MTAALFTGCGSKKETETTQTQTETAAETESEEVDDQAAADEVAALIDAIYVQTRNENTDEQCAAAKAAWDKLTDAQKELVEEKMLTRIISEEIQEMHPRMIL